MNVEELRNYCLSLGTDVEEKMPFQAFKAANGVLAFYVCGHMFCYFDIDRYELVNVKCQPDRIGELKERYDSLLRELAQNSYKIVKQQYSRKKK